MLELLRIIIYYPLINLLMFFIWLTPGHYAAVGIILLTLAVRFALLIPSKRAAQTQRKMQQIQPLLDELKAEYGNDKQGLALAQMELYKKNNINAFGNCLSLLVQLPILLTLYYAIRDGLRPDSPHLYAWLPRPEFINTELFTIGLTAPDTTFVLPVLAALLQYWQMKITLPKPAEGAPSNPMAASQRTMIYLLPAMTLIFASSFPAGVALYWIVASVFSIVQQTYVNKEKYQIAGVGAALKEADEEHPEHKKRSEKVMREIREQTTADTKSGVTVTVRRKKKS